VALAWRFFALHLDTIVSRYPRWHLYVSLLNLFTRWPWCVIACWSWDEARLNLPWRMTTIELMHSIELCISSHVQRCIQDVLNRTKLA
jgi:hypothetical protein